MGTAPVRIGRQQTNPGRWQLVLLAAVVAALAAILFSVTAPAAAAVGADTRVGALSVVGVRGAGVDKEFTYGSDAADWVNETMGADPYSLNGIMGQVTFAFAPIGPVGLAGKAASGTRLLRGATTLSRTTKAAKSADDWPILSGIVRDAGRGKGNFGVGSGTASQATRAGKSLVGEGYRIASDGTTLVSRDGLRSYRPPSWKPDLGKYQANNSYWIGERVGKPVGNGHLDVTDMGP